MRMREAAKARAGGPNVPPMAVRSPSRADRRTQAVGTASPIPVPAQRPTAAHSNKLHAAPDRGAAGAPRPAPCRVRCGGAPAAPLPGRALQGLAARSPASPSRHDPPPTCAAQQESRGGRQRAAMAAATAQLASFETGHGDMVHDAAFDYYGKRLATCSSDRSIKVFDVVGEQVRNNPRRCAAARTHVRRLQRHVPLRAVRGTSLRRPTRRSPTWQT